MAEVFNWMAMPVRKEDSLFKSMIAMEALLRTRQKVLGAKIQEIKNMIAVEHPQQATPWETLGEVPAVSEENENLRVQATRLQYPTVVAGSNGMKFSVASESDVRGWVVDASMFLDREGKDRKICYEDICTCGKPASSKVGCKHVTKVIRTTDSVNKAIMKPWLSTTAWDKQVGLAWDAIDAHEMADAVQFQQVELQHAY